MSALPLCDHFCYRFLFLLLSCKIKTFVGCECAPGDPRMNELKHEGLSAHLPALSPACLSWVRHSSLLVRSRRMWELLRWHTALPLSLLSLCLSDIDFSLAANFLTRRLMCLQWWFWNSSSWQSSILLHMCTHTYMQRSLWELLQTYSQCSTWLSDPLVSLWYPDLHLWSLC